MIASLPPLKKVLVLVLFIIGSCSLSAVAQNTITNPEFDQGTSNWTLDDWTGAGYSNGGSSYAVVTGAGLSGNSSCYVNVVNTNNGGWTLRLKQDLSFLLQVGRTYSIKFIAKAESNRTINAAFNGAASDYWTTSVNLTTTPQTFSYQFTCNNAAVANETVFGMSFYLAKGVISDVWIDKVWVEDITGMTAVTGLSVSPSTLSVNTSETSQLTKTITPANATNQNVSWTSSNTAVATVNSAGLVTGVSAGSATVTALSVNGGFSATSAITVVNSIPVTGVSVSPSVHSLTPGQIAQLSKTIVPANATNQNVTWSSSNTSIATVNTTGLITAVAEGTATITATTASGGFTASSSLTVLPPGSNGTANPEFDLGLNNWTYYDGAGVSNPWSVVSNAGMSGANALYVDIVSNSNTYWQIQPKSLLNFKLMSGRTYAIRFMAKAQTARNISVALRGEQSNSDLWSSSASLSTTPQSFNFVFNFTSANNPVDTQFSVAFFLAMGVVSDVWIDKVLVEDITGITVVTGVSVSPTTLNINTGATGQLTKTIAPANATNQNVSWTSSNTAVATVNSSGLVTGVSAGSATITATTQNGGRTATSAVTVVTSIPVTGVSVSPSALSLTPGQIAQLSKTIVPANASDQNVTWSSSNTSIATVNSSSGLVTAFAEGSVTVTATAVSGGLTGTSSVTVLPAGSNGTMNPEFDLGLSNWQFYDGTGVSNPWSVVTNGGLSGANSLYLDVVSNASTNWQLQARQILNFKLQSGRTYAIRFMAKAQSARNITVALRGEQSNSDLWNSNVSLTTSPQSFNLVFPFTSANNPTDIQFSVAFYLAMGVVSDVWIDKVLVEDITGVTAVTGVSVSPTTLNINTGATGQLTKTITPANATNQNVTWTSSNPAVATVNSSGLVTGVSAGTATLTVTTQNGGRTATSAITVTDIAVTGVGVTPTSLSLSAGQTGQLSKTITPANATNQNVNWISSNQAIATVNTSGLVTAVASGSATITATTVAGGFTATSTVNVIVPVTGVSVSPSVITLTAGQTSQLTKTVAPANATNQTVTWSSNNASVATVDNSGLVTAASLGGLATITATTVDGAFTAQAQITVQEIASETSVFEKFAFQYKYDDRKRMTHKKVPGADWVYMVYDDRDRLVMTQDGVQRTKSPREWTFTKYDVLNRPILTGIYLDTESNDQDGMQTDVNAFYTPTTNNKLFEARGGNVHGYTNQSFPNVSSENQYLTVSYYDNYSFIPLIGTNAPDYEYDNTRLVASGNDEAQEAEEFNRVQGQMTGSRIKNLETNEWMWSVNYYDDRYRSIQVIAQNSKGGLDKITNVYDFTGKVLRTKTDHTVTGASTVATTRKLTYDHAGRLLQTEHKTNNNAAVVITKNDYNELGQLVTKKLHSEDAGSNFKQHVDYRYNIRGWLTRVNNSDLNELDGGPKDFFGMELGYNNDIGVASPSLQFNGNISAIKYSTNQGLGINVGGEDPILEATERGYAFEYDAMNRLKEATHREKTLGWNPTTAYREGGLQYDLNGNILNLDRKGKAGADMDELTYQYSGNRLMRVTDAEDIDEGFKDGNTSGDDYIYDANGNMITDRNKNIASIAYNHLNLPSIVTKTTGEHINYIYNAAGVKMSQEVYDASSALTKKTDYSGEFIYENGTLQFINHEEGRIVMTGEEPEYQYTLKDHLGNSRITFTSEEEIESAVATLETENETEERASFLKYDDVRLVNSTFFDHTNTATTKYSIRLTGTPEETYGLARSISVMPGDKIIAEVFAKYVDLSQPNVTTALRDFILLVATGTASPGTVIDGGSYGSTGAMTLPFGGLLDKTEETGDAPKAYLNYLVFDKDYQLIISKSGYQRVSIAASENGQFAPEGNLHELLQSPEIEITQPGYVYIYLSNEEGGKEVYFDDFKVEHSKSPVIQQDDYYPFGLTFNSYQRENSVKNKFKFQGQEHIDDLDLDWDSFKWRNHQPEIGRFFNVDPLADKYVYNSPYAFAENRVIDGRELEGLEWVNAKGQQIYDPKANEGKGDYTKYATNNEKTLGNSLRQTDTGKAQFAQLVSTGQKTTVILNEGAEVVRGKDGKLQAGKTDKEGFTDIVGKKFEVDVVESTITLNIQTAGKLHTEAQKDDREVFVGSEKVTKDISFTDLLGVILGHEIQHTTDSNATMNANGGDFEGDAYKVSDNILKELKAIKSKK